VVAGVTLFPMTAKRGGPAGLNRLQHAPLRARQGGVVLSSISLPMTTQYLRHLQAGTPH
jgi:hypothetical protein